MIAPRMQSRGSRQQSAESCTREWMEEHSMTSVTVLFGLGVAVGLLLGHTIAESTGRKMFHEDTLTEKLTGQIRDIVKNTLPPRLSRHFS